MGTQIYDSKTKQRRQVKRSDIVVLLRSIVNVEVFESEFAKCGILSTLISESNFFEIPEILDLVNFLKIIENPYDDIALLASMRRNLVVLMMWILKTSK